LFAKGSGCIKVFQFVMANACQIPFVLLYEVGFGDILLLALHSST